MKSRPIHQNLDTSFVNLSALVKYLQRRQFVGRVNIQLNGYKAEVLVKKNNQLSVQERDEISGRTAEGKEAYQRLLIRSREPGGSINVYQIVGSSQRSAKRPVKKVPVKTAIKSVEVKSAKKPKLQASAVSASTNGAAVQPAMVANGREPRVDTESRLNPKFKPKFSASRAEFDAVPTPAGTSPSLPDFPFELTNKFEAKAEAKKLSTAEWTALLKLTVELVGVIDRSLGEYGLDFGAAFRKARTEIAGDFPFMNPPAQIFDYESGRITMTKQVNETIFVASIIESLRRIFNKLGQNEKFAEPHREFAHLVIALMNKRESEYDRFGMTVPLRRMLGV